MKRKYFKNCQSLHQLKEEYRKLLKQHHPDNGGSVEIMQEINAEYDFLEKVLPDIELDEDQQPEQQETTAKGINAAMQAVIDAIRTIPGLNLEICGKWLWITGDTYPVKEVLKKSGCRFSGKKKMWYWHNLEETHIFHSKNIDMDSIRVKYGSEKVDYRVAALA